MPCPIHGDPDPFGEARRQSGVLVNEFDGEPIPMVLRHGDLREISKDWQTFSSDAPFRVPIPSEENVRSVRQLPLEVDPPEHTEYRSIAETFFARRKDPAVILQIEALIDRMVTEAREKETVEIVKEFALPLQSRALACLLKMPPSEADIWTTWGTHIFREGDGESKGAALEVYLNECLDRERANPSDSFFGQLLTARYQDRLLTEEERLGYANIMFAAGRDTIINSVTGAIGYLADDSGALEFLREDPKRIVLASEEFFRTITPTTHIARVCPRGAELHGVEVPPEGRIALCYASANHDETVFAAPEEVRLDRKPNPHVAFGFGAHICLGAPFARIVLRGLLASLCQQIGRITKLHAMEKIECQPSYRRILAYDSLTVRLANLQTTGGD